jgi:hypothetical protein
MAVGDRFLMTQLSSMADGLNPPGVSVLVGSAYVAASATNGVGVPPTPTTTSKGLSLRRNRAPVLHVFGHVHAQQSAEEPAAGPRFCADGTTGVLFLNCAAERKVCAIAGAAHWAFG